MYILTCLHTQESMDSILSIPGDHEEVKSLEWNSNTFKKSNPNNNEKVLVTETLQKGTLMLKG